MNIKDLIAPFSVIFVVVVFGFFLRPLGIVYTSALLVVTIVFGLLFFRRDRLFGLILVSGVMSLQDPIKQQAFIFFLSLMYLARWASPKTYRQEIEGKFQRDYIILFAFGVVAFVTGIYRGFLRGAVFTGETMYIWVLIIPLFLMAVSASKPAYSEVRFKRFIPWLTFWSLVPVFIEILIARGFMFFTYALYFVHISVNRLVVNMQVSNYDMRYRMAYMPSMMIVVLAFILQYYVKRKVRKNMLFLLLIFVSVALSSLTGYRKNLVGLILLISLGGYVISSHKPRYILVGLLVGSIGLAGAYTTAKYLSFGLQRQLSFLPGIELSSAHAISSAEVSGRGRRKLFRYCYDRGKADGYFLVGRGLAPKRSDIADSQFKKDQVGPWGDFAILYLAHNYHSMFLQLVIDNGILGFSLYVLFLIVFISRRYHLFKQYSASLWRDAGLVLLVALFSHSLIYLLFSVSFYEFYTYGIVFVILAEMCLKFAKANQQDDIVSE